MRRPDWEARLSVLITNWQHAPFAWGERDCAQLALAVLKAVSARDWAQLSVQPYKTARGARALLRQLEVADMAELAGKLLGPALAISFARRGDLISCHSPFGPALGVCLGTHVALCGPQGLIFKPLHDAFSCWRI